MTGPHRPAHPGPERDFVGYGPEPPDFDWPGGARIAISLVVNYEEGGEYSLNTDGVNDTWGEYSFQYGPDIRDIGTETHMEYGSRVGIWRLCRLIDRYQIPVTFSARRPDLRLAPSLLREPQAQPRLPARGGPARLRRAADVGRRPLPLERAAGTCLRGQGFHRVRAGPGRRALHAPY